MRRVVLALILLLTLVAAWWFLRAPSAETDSPVSAGVASALAERAVELVGEPLVPPDRDAADARDTSTGAAGVATCTLRGRVVDNHQRPVARALVQAFSWHREPWHVTQPLPPCTVGFETMPALETRTALDGSFELEGPAPTSSLQNLRITPGMYFTRELRQYGAAQFSDAPSLVAGVNELGTFVVIACGAVSGRVFSSDGAPLVGADVYEGRGASHARTDAEGRFLLAHVLSSVHGLLVSARGHRDATVERFQLRVGETIEHPPILLERIHEVRGLVVDTDGAAVSGIHVSPRLPGGGGGPGETSDEQGRFVLELEPGLSYVASVARSAGHGAWGGPDEPAARIEPDTENLRVVLQRTPEFAVCVVDERTRTPVEIFALQSEPVHTEFPSWLRTNSAAPIEHHPRGETRVPAEPETHILFVSAPGYVPARVPVVEDAPGTRRQTVELRRGATLGARVLRGGKPLHGARLELARESMDQQGQPTPDNYLDSGNARYDISAFAGQPRVEWTGSDGRARFEALAGGTQRLRIGARGCTPRLVRGVAIPLTGEVELGDVELDPSSTLTGTLLVPEGGSPLGHVVQVMQPADGDTARRCTIQDPQGSFRIDDLSPGRYALQWKRPGEDRPWGWRSPSDREQGFDVGAGQLHELTVDTRPFEPCRVVVRVHRGGVSAAGVGVQLQSLDISTGLGRSPELLPTDAAGRTEGRVDGGFEFVVALQTNGPWMPVSSTRSIAPAGGRLQFDVEVTGATLVLELPESFELPVSGELTFNLHASGDPVTTVRALTPNAQLERQRELLWEGRLLELGEFAPGHFDVEVLLHRIDGRIGQPRTFKRVPLREPFRTTIEVRAGERTVIQVP